MSRRRKNPAWFFLFHHLPRSFPRSSRYERKSFSSYQSAESSSWIFRRNRTNDTCLDLSEWILRARGLDWFSRFYWNGRACLLFNYKTRLHCYIALSILSWREYIRITTSGNCSVDLARGFVAREWILVRIDARVFRVRKYSQIRQNIIPDSQRVTLTGKD